MDDADIALISRWGRSVRGPIVDAGSGPGHWTEHLRTLGSEIRGVEVVPAFVDSARQRFPDSDYEVGDFRALPVEAGNFGGVLSWYSIIHMQPDQTGSTFEEFARVLRPGGTLLIGAFLGAQSVQFDHAITTAYFWSESGLSSALEAVGFRTIEAHTRSIVGSRRHLAIVAERP
ncbi:class I SAM-dependent methyltransferase [Rathayibacter iranicus]|nr:class I SAM-dependent methyltransferase [Rathayibacter iranicus]